MAIIQDGILGAFTGRVGPVTGFKRNGINIMRTARSGKDKKITPGRAAQREKMKVCNAFTKPFCGTGFFSRTFPADGTSATGYSRATSAIMNLAVSGTYPEIVISYPDVLISRGQLPGAESASATLGEDENITFTWENNSGKGTAKGKDKVILVAYFPQMRQVLFTIGAATRADKLATLETKSMKGAAAETWIGFLSNDEKIASDSVYCGSLE